MATLVQCDKCKTLNGVTGKIQITRQRMYSSQHDGLYKRATIIEYDVCEKCAREIELLFISEKEADKVLQFNGGEAE